MAAKRLNKEFTDLERDPVPGCSASLEGDDIFRWRITITGFDGTVYEGGCFFLEFKFPTDYPFKPLRIKWLTKIYHPNVHHDSIDFCLPLISNVTGEWSPALMTRKVLISLVEVLKNPVPFANGSCPHCSGYSMNMEAMRQYVENKSEFDRIAREWTKKYAT